MLEPLNMIGLAVLIVLPSAGILIAALCVSAHRGEVAMEQFLEQQSLSELPQQPTKNTTGQVSGDKDKPADIKLNGATPLLAPKISKAGLCVLAFFLLISAASAAVVTAYFPCAKCCGQAGNLTKSGTIPKQGITIAAPRSVPLGTVVYVEGIGPRIVEDRKHRRFNRSYDVFFYNHAEALRFGKKQLNVTVIRP